MLLRRAFSFLESDHGNEAQIAANQANAQHSTGPRTSEGKLAIAQNNLRYGFTGRFSVLPWEDHEELQFIHRDLAAEHRPVTGTEEILVEKMAQSYWLARRAIGMQRTCFNQNSPICERPKDLALFLRYETTHDRAFHTALNQLLKLRAETRKDKIGFESQSRKQADESRKHSNENRRQELHQWAVWLAEAKLTHQQVLTNGAQGSQFAAAIAEEDRLKAQKAA